MAAKEAHGGELNGQSFKGSRGFLGHRNLTRSRDGDYLKDEARWKSQAFTTAHGVQEELTPEESRAEPSGTMMGGRRCAH